MKFPRNRNCPEVKNGLGVPFSRMENMALMRGCRKGSEFVSFGAHYWGLLTVKLIFWISMLIVGWYLVETHMKEWRSQCYLPMHYMIC